MHRGETGRYETTSVGGEQVRAFVPNPLPRLAEMFKADRARMERTGRRAGSAIRVHEALKSRPILSMAKVCRITGLSFPAAASAMGLLGELGIARELTGKRRNRLFVYEQYLSTLNEGTEPP